MLIKDGRIDRNALIRLQIEMSEDFAPGKPRRIFVDKFTPLPHRNILLN